MIRKHNRGIVRRNDHGRAWEAARRFGIWALTMAAVVACLAGAGILLAPAEAEGPVVPLLDMNNAGEVRLKTEGQCR